MRCLERFFWLLERVSLGELLRGPYARAGTTDGWYKAGNVIDTYMCVWLAIEVLLYVTAGSVAAWLVWILVGYRLIEIIQVYGNTLMFTELRAAHHGRRYTVISVSRTLVQMVFLLVEAMLLYGLAFFLVRDHITGLKTAADALYLSIGTMTTGTIVPSKDWVRFLGVSELLLGFFAAVTILGRVVGLLPRIADLTDRGDDVQDLSQ